MAFTAQVILPLLVDQINDIGQLDYSENGPSGSVLSPIGMSGFAEAAISGYPALDYPGMALCVAFSGAQNQVATFSPILFPFAHRCLQPSMSRLLDYKPGAATTANPG